MYITLDVVNILLIIVLVFNIFLGFVIFNDGRKKKVNVIYDYNIIAILAWTVGMLFYRSSVESTSLFWCIFLYLPPTIIASSFLYFTYIFPENEKEAELKIKKIFFINFLVILMTMVPGLIIKNVNIRPGLEKEIIFGNYYFLYALYTCGFFSYGFFRLFKKFKRSSGIKKQQILYLLIGYFISANLAFVTNLIMPWLGYFSLNWAGQFLTIFMVGFATYAILKHNLFNVKVIATEIFVFIQVIILLVRAVLSVSLYDKFTNYGILIGTALIGFFLIKSVQKEVNSRQEIQLLAGSLEEANSKLKEIDLRKNDFINIASHQLRTPMTAVKGYSTLLVDGAYGDFDPKIKEIISRINGLTDQSVKIINDMLNISRIERNTMRYVFEKVDIVEFLTEILKNLKLKADAKNLQYEYVFDEKLSNVENKIYVNVDKTLLAQVFENVVDNSIKYTLKGYVKIDIKLKGKKLIFNCVDSGIGIDKESQASLFKKFTRAKNAEGSGIEGSGIGLYLAKEIMTKHKGDISISSEGENKGSQTLITLSI